jgi:hypothetical protein
MLGSNIAPHEHWIGPLPCLLQYPASHSAYLLAVHCFCRRHASNSASDQAGQPETILGKPVVEAVDMGDVASGTFPILFGDIGTAYRIVDRIDLSVLVNPYLLATNSTTRMHASRRVGGGVVQPAAIKKLKMATS